ncbi:MAG: hypothetical protein ACI8VT_004328 [Saprospiraceae bacterium]|jgi:hypothetical protein
MKIEYDKHYQKENLFGKPYPELIDESHHRKHRVYGQIRHFFKNALNQKEM